MRVGKAYINVCYTLDLTVAQIIILLFQQVHFHSIIGKKSLAEMRKFYFEARDDVFQDPKGGISYDTDAMQTMLLRVFGTEMRMNDVKYPRYTCMYYTVWACFVINKDTLLWY